MTNFLEQLAAEWYSYTDYFVRTNICLNPRPKGGWANELDVLAFSIARGELIHLEASSDADSWDERKKKFLTKKFVFSQLQYENIVGAQIQTIRKIALVGSVRKSKANLVWGQGIEVILVPSFIAIITANLATKDPMKAAVPEGFPRLRAMQFALAYGA